MMKFHIPVNSLLQNLLLKLQISLSLHIVHEKTWGLVASAGLDTPPR